MQCVRHLEDGSMTTCAAEVVLFGIGYKTATVSCMLGLSQEGARSEL